MPPCPSNWRISYRFPSTVPGWRVAGEPAANPAGVPGAGTDQPSATCRVSVTVAPPTSGGVAVIVALLPGSGVSHFSQRAAAGGLVNWHWGQSIAVAASRAAGGFHIRDFPRRNQAFPHAFRFALRLVSSSCLTCSFRRSGLLRRVLSHFIEGS